MRYALAVLFSLSFGLAALAQEPRELLIIPIGFAPDLPTGMPNPESWKGVTNQLAISVENLKSGKEAKHVLALRVVQEGLCADNDQDICYLGIRYEFSYRLAEAQQRRELVQRYVFVSRAGVRLEGIMYGRESDVEQAGTYFYWVRRHGAWVQQQLGTPEYRLDDAFLEWLAETVIKAPAPDNPQPKPTPGTRTIATR